MEINNFIKKLEAEFEEIPPGTLQPETHFRTLKDWGSMHALIVIALIDTEYGVTINGEELRSVATVSELFELTRKKKSTNAGI